MTDDPRVRLKEIIAAGREDGFLLESYIREMLPPEIIDEEQIQDLIMMIGDMAGVEIRNE